MFVLSSRTAGRIKQSLDQGGTVGGRAKTNAPVRGVTWCKITDEPDEDGWHPAVVSLDDRGTWQDLTEEVLVAAADGSTLAVDSRHLCTRCGNDGETPRFMASAAGSTPPLLFHNGSNFTAGFWSGTGAADEGDMYLPEAGPWRIDVGLYAGIVETPASDHRYYLDSRLYDVTAAAEVDASWFNVARRLPYDDLSGVDEVLFWGFNSTIIELTEPSVIRLQLRAYDLSGSPDTVTYDLIEKKYQAVKLCGSPVTYLDATAAPE